MIPSPYNSSNAYLLLLLSVSTSLKAPVYSYTTPIAFRVPASCTPYRFSAVSHKYDFLRSNPKLHMAANDDDDDVSTYEAEVITNNSNFNMGDDEEEEWLPDREKAKRRAAMQNKYANEVTTNPPKPASSKTYNSNDTWQQQQQKKNSVYTEEEEELISAMGGKSKRTLTKNGQAVTKREPGYLGDSTLKEISMDYSVPICYLADVLATWGVPVPIDVNSQLGDLITGEQAFAILEAIHTLDLGALNDRYCDQDLMMLCEEYDVELKDAFEFAVKEGWNLPFGVRTFLRVEQEEELLRALVDDAY